MKDAAKKFRKTCEKCNKPFSTANESEVLCRECRMRDDFAKRRAEDEARKEADAKSNEVFETRKCVDCGHEFDITNRDRDFFESHGYSLPNRCPECRKIHRDFVKRGLDNIGLEDTCADCGQKLQFTNRELYWYVVHDYKLPTRCKACREKRNEHFAKIAAKKVTADGVKDAVIEAPINESVAEDANVPAITGDITSPAETVTETPVEAAAETASNTTPDANGASAYEVVTEPPLGYIIWNIGDNAPEGYLPFCRLKFMQPFEGGREIESDTLKAMKCDGAREILAAIGLGAETSAEMKEFIKKHERKSPLW